MDQDVISFAGVMLTIIASIAFVKRPNSTSFMVLLASYLCSSRSLRVGPRQAVLHTDG